MEIRHKFPRKKKKVTQIHVSFQFENAIQRAERTFKQRTYGCSAGKSMNKAAAFLMAMRSPVLFELLTKKQHAFHLLFFIAYTLNRDGSPNIYGCRLGESRVSYKGNGLTNSQFRTAKKYLQEAELAEFYTRGHGKGKKAYAKLTNTNLFDPNIIPKEHPLEQHNQSNSDSIGASKNLE